MVASLSLWLTLLVSFIEGFRVGGMLFSKVIEHLPISATQRTLHFQTPTMCITTIGKKTLPHIPLFRIKLTMTYEFQ